MQSMNLCKIMKLFITASWFREFCLCGLSKNVVFVFKVKISDLKTAASCLNASVQQFPLNISFFIVRCFNKCSQGISFEI